MGAPYKRGWKHTKSKGRESSVNCGFCGRTVPRWKTFVKYSGFSITDPVLRKSIDPRHVSQSSFKVYVCPACARYRGMAQAGRSRKTRGVKR